MDKVPIRKDENSHGSVLMQKLPHAQIWQKNLLKTYDGNKIDTLIFKAKDYYDGFYRMHSSETNRANQKVLKTRVLPGLAIYKVLLEENENHQKVLNEVDVLFKAAFFTGRMQGIRILNYLRDPFRIVKPMMKMMTRVEYLPGSQEIVEDSADCYALNVYRCFILDTLAAHNAKELTALFCNTDDWLAEELPKISWERTKTLGRGGDCCDFRWSRIK